MLKEKLRSILDEYPEEVDVDAFLKKVYLLQQLEIAEKQIARGEVIPHEIVKQRLLGP
jgi:hypothetical protein